MAKIHHVRRATKSRPEHGIVRGAEYWWWWRRAPGQRTRGVIHYSATYPRPSQLAGSPVVAEVLHMKESLEDATRTATDDDISAVCDQATECVGRLHEMLDEQTERFNAIPRHLRGGKSAEVIRGRREVMRNIYLQLAVVSVVDRQPDPTAEKLREALGEVDWSIE